MNLVHHIKTASHYISSCRIHLIILEYIPEMSFWLGRHWRTTRQLTGGLTLFLLLFCPPSSILITYLQHQQAICGSAFTIDTTIIAFNYSKTWYGVHCSLTLPFPWLLSGVLMVIWSLVPFIIISAILLSRFQHTYYPEAMCFCDFLPFPDALWSNRLNKGF